ncbi:MAG: 5'-methylthioadenosine/S-adenosylhomocysteine nucleosidase [Bacteroidetes bacterium]|nr:5'-methylthioadenosine/S-adenosylhomocysteine nucleosidase [Bacteroidota bacterium]
MVEILAPRRLHNSPYGEWFEYESAWESVIVVHGGWGKIAAAASAQYAIDHWKPLAILNIGTCGGLAGRAAVGDIILAERTVVSDFVVEIGNLEEEEAAYITMLEPPALFRSRLPLSVLQGTIASGDRDVQRHDVQRLVERYDALAADWESASIAFVAKQNGVPCAILRGVSDVVGEHHADAYDGRDHAFHNGTRTIMRRLLGELPSILEAVATAL